MEEGFSVGLMAMFLLVLGQLALHGFGVFTSLDGDVYSGNWKTGKLDGRGNLNWANGDHFSGCLSNGLRHGFGVYRCVNGDVYSGNWKKDKMDGRGSMNWANGDVFDGCWSNGLIHESGVFRFANGDVDIGNFKSRLLYDNGTYTCSDRTMYKGCICSNEKVIQKGLMIWSLQNPDGGRICANCSSGVKPLIIEREYMKGVLIVEKIRQYSKVTHNKKNKKQDAFNIAKKVKQRSCVWAFLNTIKAIIES
jgi:1-phosphatidylinositol-4-phosphate 5-kinase